MFYPEKGQLPGASVTAHPARSYPLTTEDDKSNPFFDNKPFGQALPGEDGNGLCNPRPLTYPVKFSTDGLLLYESAILAGHPV
ncbi:hypothetical protein BLX24_29570 [Arsenicibacter rosenii]|uniref:Uncharacterized protein n=1 Tax=Arsenicibacter rosenii TaxID=1750698 RepID=A0A1S2VA57_9BACT|nr:hypothetical protein BLX24_29570 [Arsenicibacter rosenii]